MGCQIPSLLPSPPCLPSCARLSPLPPCLPACLPPLPASLHASLLPCLPASFPTSLHPCLPFLSPCLPNSLPPCLHPYLPFLLACLPSASLPSLPPSKYSIFYVKKWDQRQKLWGWEDLTIRNPQNTQELIEKWIAGKVNISLFSPTLYTLPRWLKCCSMCAKRSVTCCCSTVRRSH